MKKKIIIASFILLALIAIAISITYHIQNKVHYNTGFVSGNSAGNLYNGGLFCENNGVVYFANPDDEYRLYSMSSNGTNLQKLCNDSVSYINADNHYIYYVRNSRFPGSNTHSDFGIEFTRNDSLCRISKKGGKPVILDSASCMYASLIGNSIFYLHYDESSEANLYKIDIDGENLKQLQNYYVYTCSTLDKYFYYNGMKTNGSIYQYDTTTGNVSLFYECNSYKPIVVNPQEVYYLDVDKDNALVHCNPQKNNPVTLSSDNVDCYNLYGSYLYYQQYNEDSPGLCMVKNDGSESSMIAPGNFSSIHITSYYIYFMDFKTKEFYYTSTSNPGVLTAFHPGKIEDK